MNCGIHRIGVAGMKAMPAAAGSSGGGTSIVESGGYDGAVDTGDALTFLGSGGAVLSGETEDGTKINMRTNSDKTVDQKDEKTNRAFQYNKGRPDKPVRVVRGTDGGKLVKALKEGYKGGVPDAEANRFPWNDGELAERGSGGGGGGGGGGSPRRSARGEAPAQFATGVPATFGPYDDAGDACWLSSYPRALGPFGRELDYFFRSKRGGIQAFRPVGIDKVYRYDGLYLLRDWEFKRAPWATPAAELKAFYFHFDRAPLGGKQTPGAWTPAGSECERATVALWEATVRARVRDALPVDAVAAYCGVPLPSAAADAALLDYARATGGQTDEAYGVWWGGDLRAAQAFALARAAGGAAALPALPEDAALVRAFAADGANAAAWARLREGGAARRAHAWHVVPAAVSAAEAAFACGITQDFPAEPVTCPCGHNFERAALEQHVAARDGNELKPNCPLCAAELPGGADAWRGAPLRERVNRALLAAVAALKGAPPPPTPRASPKKAAPAPAPDAAPSPPASSPRKARGSPRGE